MMGIHAYSLYSGSAGNAFLLDANGVCILIDAGKNAKALCAAIRATGHEPEEISAVFVTHEHSDHIKALPVFLKKHPIPVHLPLACAYKLEGEPSATPHLLPHPPIHTEEIGGIRISSFPTPHDSRGSVGYRIEIPTENGIFRIGYATDIGHVTDTVEENLMGCDAVVLESNHDPEMLMDGPYPYDLKLRIASKRGHLCNADSACLASRLCENGTKTIMLAHLSQENNTPDTAYSEYLGQLASDEIHIHVAAPDTVVEMKLEDIASC